MAVAWETMLCDMAAMVLDRPNGSVFPAAPARVSVGKASRTARSVSTQIDLIVEDATGPRECPGRHCREHCPRVADTVLPGDDEELEAIINGALTQPVTVAWPTDYEAPTAASLIEGLERLRNMSADLMLRPVAMPRFPYDAHVEATPALLDPEELAGKVVRLHHPDGTHRDVTFGEVQYPSPDDRFEVSFTITPVEEKPDATHD